MVSLCECGQNIPHNYMTCPACHATNKHFKLEDPLKEIHDMDRTLRMGERKYATHDVKKVGEEEDKKKKESDQSSVDELAIKRVADGIDSAEDETEKLKVIKANPNIIVD